MSGNQNWLRVADTDALAVNECQTVKVGGKLIALARTEQGFHAVDNRCLHVGGSLGQGTVEAGEIVCPWHGRCYNLTTGECANVDEKIAVYRLELRGDGIYVLIED